MSPENDPGFDVGLMSSSSGFQLYSTSLSSDYKVNLMRQALPLDYHGMNIIPIGLDTRGGGEVVFSAVTVPYGRIRYWLRDTETGSLTDLSADSKVVIPLILTEQAGSAGGPVRPPSARQDQDLTDPQLQIWAFSGDIIIKGEAGVGASCEIFDMHGSKILEERLNGGDLNTVDVPSGYHGVFLVRVTDGMNITTTKVVLNN